MTKLKIGILYSPQVDMRQYLASVTKWGYPKLIVPGEKAGIDVLIIPDGIGAYPGMPAFANALIPPTVKTSMCTYAEAFRISMRGLSYYIEERDTVVVGVGDGRCMLWDYAKGKIGIGTNGEYKLLTDSVDISESLVHNGLFTEVFKINNKINGVPTLDKHFKSTLENIYVDILTDMGVLKEQEQNNKLDSDTSSETYI